MAIILGWTKSPFGFTHKIKDTFLIFTNNFIDLDILSMWLPHTWFNVDCSQCLDLIAINFNCLPSCLSTQPWSIVQCEISSIKLCKPLLTCSISHSTFSIHGTNLFLCFSCVFPILAIIKHNMPKTCMFFHLQY